MDIANNEIARLLNRSFPQVKSQKHKTDLKLNLYGFAKALVKARLELSVKDNKAMKKLSKGY